MRKRYFGSLAALVAGASLALGQEPALPLPLLPPTPPLPAPSAAVSSHPAVPLPDCGAQSGSQVWASVDPLFWWLKGGHTPPLLVTGPAPQSTGLVNSFTPLPGTGFIALQTIAGTPATLNLNTANQVLFNNDLSGRPRFGGRFGVGGWLDTEQTFGVEANYFYLSTTSLNRHDSSAGTPALAIPFFDPTFGQGKESGYTVAQPATIVTTIVNVNTTPGVFVHLFTTTVNDAITGNVAFTSSTKFQGGEANGFWILPGITAARVEVLAGFRYAQLNEELGIISAVTDVHNESRIFEPALGLPTGGIPVLNNFTAVTTKIDQFSTHNWFYGGQVGARGEYSWDRFTVQVGGKVALGYMKEVVDVSGLTNVVKTSTTTPTKSILLAGIPLDVAAAGAANVTATTNTTTLGGLFAQPSNIRNLNRDVFAVVPEGNIQGGYQLNEYVRATVGYNFVYLSNVVRPANQISRLVNPNQQTGTPNPPVPILEHKGTDFWAQGVQCGLEFRF